MAAKGYVPPEAHCVRSLAFFIRKQVRTIRQLKHGDGLTVQQVNEHFPHVSYDWIYRIAFYKTWRLIEFETGVVTIMCDLYEIDSFELLELAKQFGFRMTLQDEIYISKYEPEYRNIKAGIQ